MSEIVEKLRNVADLKNAGGCSIAQIKSAQNELDVIFSDEYLDFLKTFGAVRFNAIEWFGLNVNGYLNVVEATKQEISVNEKFPQGYWVIEDLGIDAKLIIMNEKSQVFMLQYDKIKPLCDSLSKYLDICIARKL